MQAELPNTNTVDSLVNLVKISTRMYLSMKVRTLNKFISNTIAALVAWV